MAVSFHFNNYIYALDSKFTPIQISTFCSIMKALLDISIGKTIKFKEEKYSLLPFPQSVLIIFG